MRRCSLKKLRKKKTSMLTLFTSKLKPSRSRRMHFIKGHLSPLHSRLAQESGMFRKPYKIVRFVWHEAAPSWMIIIWHHSTARAIREQTDPRLSNHSRSTLMSYTNHSAWRQFKSNKPNVNSTEKETCLETLWRFFLHPTASHVFTWKSRLLFVIGSIIHSLLYILTRCLLFLIV